MTGPDPASSAFRLTGVEVRLGGRTVLDGVDLAVGAGESVAILGPSGAGKTTLLRLVNGIVSPAAGEVAVGGISPAAAGPSELRALRSRIGFIHQDLRLVPNPSPFFRPTNWHSRA